MLEKNRKSPEKNKLAPSEIENRGASPIGQGQAGEGRSAHRCRGAVVVSQRVMYVVALFSTEYAMGGPPIRYSVENSAKAYITDVPKKLWSLTPPSLAREGHNCDSTRDATSKDEKSPRAPARTAAPMSATGAGYRCRLPRPRVGPGVGERAALG